jgi:protein TonB
MAMNWSIYQKREATAQVGTALIALLALVISQSWSMHQEVAAQDTSISLSIMTPSVETEQKIQPPQPQKNVEQHQEVMPESEMPTQVKEKVVEQATPTPPVEAVKTHPQAVNPAVELEAMYVAKVRGYLASVKRYPTGREASIQRPSGKAVIWFVLKRNGSLIESGIETSSGSMLLDSSALATVRRANYTAFPEESWAGQTQHRFSVELDFVPPSS